MFTAFTLGLVGSLHCIVMCGPLLLALPFGLNAQNKAFFSVLLYHKGRISAYIAIGILLGFGGGQLVSIPYMQQVLTLAAGILLLSMVLYGNVLERHLRQWAFFSQMIQQINKFYAILLKRGGYFTVFGLGVLNGLIPCGMVYAAAVGAMSTGSALNAGVFMLLYGLGTLPVLLLLQWGGLPYGQALRIRLRKLQPVFLFILGLFFLYRGLFFNASILDFSVPPAVFECH